MPYEITVTTEAEDAPLVRRRMRQEAQYRGLKLTTREPRPVTPTPPRAAWYIGARSKQQKRGYLFQMGELTLVTDGRRTRAVGAPGRPSGYMFNDPDELRDWGGGLWEARTSEAEKGRWRRRLRALGFEPRF
jgi:hypothetical protein